MGLEHLEEEMLRKRAQRLRDRLVQDFGEEVEDQDDLEHFLEDFQWIHEASGLDTTPEIEFESLLGFHLLRPLPTI